MSDQDSSSQTISVIHHTHQKNTYVVRMRIVEVVEWQIEADSKDEAIEIARGTDVAQDHEWIDRASYSAERKAERDQEEGGQ